MWHVGSTLWRHRIARQWSLCESDGIIHFHTTIFWKQRYKNMLNIWKFVAVLYFTLFCFAEALGKHCLNFEKSVPVLWPLFCCSLLKALGEYCSKSKSVLFLVGSCSAFKSNQKQWYVRLCWNSRNRQYNVDSNIQPRPTICCWGAWWYCH